MRIATISVLLIAAIVTPAAAAPTDLDLRSGDGTVLKATWFPAAAPGPAVVLFHMCDGAGRAGWATLAAALSDAGISVLTFNYRGIEGSGGHAWPHSNDIRKATAYWRSRWSADLDAAIQYVRSQPGIRADRLAAGGASCGVTMALTAAERHADVRGLVLLSGPYHDSARAFVAQHPELAVLAAVSEEDGPAPGWMAEIVRASRNPRSSVTVYKGAGHGTHMLTREPGLQPSIVSFLTSVLR